MVRRMSEGLRSASCAGCGYEYPDASAVASSSGDDRQPCPRCGSRNVNFALELVASVTPTASAWAHKPPGADGREAIRVMRGGDDARVASADAGAAGEVDDRIEGRAARKAQSELRTAAVLVEALNSYGEEWSAPKLRTGREDGVDAVANWIDDPARELRIQVTTPERGAWALLAKVDSAERSESDATGAVEAIKAALEGKTRFAGRSEIVLALDATDSPRYALERVVQAFRAEHGEWVRGIGYDAVWLVGPVTAMVHRLDADSGSASR